MSIHKEGVKILIILTLCLLVLNLAIRYYFLDDMVLRYFIISISFILFFFVLQFFRNPIVKIPYNDKHILAPADGKVVVVEKTIEQECLKDERIQISIFMSPVNVHVSRSPASGKIKYFKYHPGKYLVAWHPKSSILNERTTMLLTMKDGLDIVVRQIAGIMARRIKYYVQEGDNLEQGAEFGFIRFGSRLDVFLPTNADVLVKPGMVTRAGKTVLAAIKG
jgi:phosphatidylserine decarboxylase